nr:dihydropyrimidinase isoform X3 [Onthophagus taurus]
MSTPVKKVPIHLQSSQNRLLIKNGQVVNDDEIFEEDIYIEDGSVKQIGRNLIIPGGTRVIDARGKYVMPGGIDPHTHFEFEFMGATSVDDFYQGTKAAIAGGTTMIIDFVMPKNGESLLDAYANYRQKADSKVCCDYALHVIVTSWNNIIKEEMNTLCHQHGVNSFKMFMAYDMMMNDGDLYSVFEHCKNIGAVPMVHAENGHIIKKNVERLLNKGITGPEGHEMSRPEEVEAEAVNRACTIAQQVNSPLYIVHVMSKSAATTLKQYREKGTNIIGETLVCALACDGSQYRHQCFWHSAGHVLSPPLRPDPNTPQFLLNFLSQ